MTLADILGDQCPDCGWTRGRHRWDCEALPEDERREIDPMRTHDQRPNPDGSWGVASPAWRGVADVTAAGGADGINEGNEEEAT